MRELEFNTFSIAARCARSGMLGIAVATKRPAVGSMVPWAQAGIGAIATQARTNPYLGVWGLELLAQGYSAGEVLERILERDEGREWRQVGVVDAEGQSAGFTGSKATPWAGGQAGPNYAVQGNILAGEEVVLGMVRAFLKSEAEPLYERLMRALEAGEAAGGDRRGKQSAALYLTHTEDYPYLDLRVDDHPEPVEELRRILEIAKMDHLPRMADLPTKANPSGKLGEWVSPSIKHPGI